LFHCKASSSPICSATPAAGFGFYQAGTSKFVPRKPADRAANSFYSQAEAGAGANQGSVECLVGEAAKDKVRVAGAEGRVREQSQGFRIFHVEDGAAA
jgi:hypothetical protein